MTIPDATDRLITIVRDHADQVMSLESPQHRALARQILIRSFTPILEELTRDERVRFIAQEARAERRAARHPESE